MMAKETMIVFVYDNECCKDEADDPVDAVLYFHPSWVSDTQKLSLCGQLMGVTYFLSTTFGRPSVISLQSGKFVLKEFGRFILAVGTDRNLSESLLKHRANMLTSLLKFFHRDIQTIHDQFSSSGQYKNLSEKLYHIFETYLPILQYNGNVFQNVPTLHLPKSASNIFLDAVQTLQSCQQTKGILGGVILYHNKVVATQLSSDVTKNLVHTDPYRIKSSAEPVSIDFYVPIGVQMLIVYIPICDYRKLAYDAQRAQNVVTQSFSNTSIPYQYQKRKLKRDKSLIFTNIPEETICDHTSASTNEEAVKPQKPANRPNHLPLRFKNVTTKDIPESGFASINFDETDSYPEFIGRTSVVSTPMTENKILHDNIMSICANPSENDTVNCDKKPNLANGNSTPNDQKKSMLKVDFENFLSNFVSNPYKEERRNSFTNLQDSLKRISKRLSLRTFGMGITKLDVNKSDEATPDYVDDIEKKKIYKTITDPTCPMFNSDGGPISQSLFDEFIDQHYSSWRQGDNNPEQINKLIEEFKEFSESKIEPASKKSSSSTNTDNDVIETPPQKTIQNRKSLTLPLKPLNEADRDQASTSSGIFEKRKMSGIQLTPLMAKLSVLALNEEKSSGFCSRDTTPGVELPTPLDVAKNFRRKSSVRPEDFVDDGKGGVQKVELYVCGQQNMTLLLLMEEGSGQKQELVQAMFDTCVSRLSRLETSLNQTLNVNVDGDKSEGGYSFICIDPEWDTVQRGGPWSPDDLVTLEHMHNDLNSENPITDMVLRTEDSVIYGYKCGRTEVFYKQAAQPQSGIPPPADIMGTIALRAKRRLERDHSLMLF